MGNPLLDYDNPLFTFDSTHLTYTPTKVCYLSGNIMTPSGSAILSIGNTEVFHNTGNNNLKFDGLKLPANKTVTLSTYNTGNRLAIYDTV